MTHHRKGMGWRPTHPDFRDRPYAALASLEHGAPLPASVDLRSTLPAGRYDQGQLGSCTAQGLALQVRQCRAKQGLPDVPGSRLFLYYEERAREGTVGKDVGADPRDGCKVLAQRGIPHESAWDYEPLNYATQPPAAAYADALSFQALEYHAVDLTNLREIKSCLAAGYVLGFGASIYESFERIGKDGMVPMPRCDQSPLGGHYTVIAGYREDGRLIGVNSWGNGWGQDGCCFWPAEYVTNRNLAWSGWTIRRCE